MAEKFFPASKLQEWREFYEKNGYLVIENFVSTKEMDELYQEGLHLVDTYFEYLEKDKSNHEFSIFSTIRQEQTSNKYFVESGDKIRFFLEEDAVNGKGELTCSKHTAINKIGHALHVLNPVFRKFTAQEKISRFVEAIVLKNAVIPQSMYIFKNPRVGGAINIHQDSTFLKTKPLSCHALWFPLEDVTMENAPIWVVPGSHRSGIVGHFKRKPDLSGTWMDKAPEECRAPWESLKKEFGDPKSRPDLWVSLPCKKGAVVVIHGSVVHMSEKNASPESRNVYTFHMVDGSAQWDPENWLQYPTFPSFEDLQNL
jgi:phytanoyl-CoA hydroxylase